MSSELALRQRSISQHLLYRRGGSPGRALILYPWLSSSVSGGIENSNGVFSGAIKKIEEECSLLTEYMSALGKANDWSGYVTRMMDLLGERLTSGVNLRRSALSSLRIRGFGRGCISRLVQNSYISSKESGQLWVEERGLARWMAEGVSRFAKLNSSIGLGENKNESQVIEVQPSTSMAILMVDRNHPGTVEYRGKTVTLTSKQFWLLVVLAMSPGKCVPYDVIYEKVWGGEVSVEMQQISYHKAQLLRRFSKVAPKAKVRRLITAVSGEGLILVLEPSNVCLI